MASRGVWYLKKLTFRYCPNSGSSQSLRQWMKDNLIDFAKENPQLQIEAAVKPNRHPLLIGEYINGTTRQICVKNNSSEDIWKQVMALRNTDGHKVTKLPFEVKPKISTFQGTYYNNMKPQDIQIELKTKL